MSSHAYVVILMSAITFLLPFFTPNLTTKSDKSGKENWSDLTGQYKYSVYAFLKLKAYTFKFSAIWKFRVLAEDKECILSTSG